VTLARYSLIVLATAGATQALASSVLEADALRAALAGAALAAANAIAAYGLALWAEGRSTTAFFGAVLGGMAARMTALLVAFVAAVRLAELPSTPLAVSLLGHFGAYLVLELGLLHRRTGARPAEAR
jgi:hypothetical protein